MKLTYKDKVQIYEHLENKGENWRAFKDKYS